MRKIEIKDEKIFETLINRSDKLQHFIQIHNWLMFFYISVIKIFNFLYTFADENTIVHLNGCRECISRRNPTNAFRILQILFFLEVKIARK